ncbi:Hemin import ATP-binding protein HmuV [Aquicella siphonis]|uniref:Hemin import ATP-binding protein HmuV n=1 Tax=Aquicella siphonis TaxID=254247 RepID=A0A5E4PF58_9COXI|nr:ABC transporter ATP-binding protein [Aquicella siphonis]VVC75619.1 Hemin import ATP-binding protein HmuV [Aquicella siphonis]
MINHTSRDVITTRGLTLGYAGKPIVANISIQISKGEFIGILGPNGSGKSTFLKAVLGLIKPLSGDIRVLGEAPAHGSSDLGYMPQMRQYASAANLSCRSMLEASYQGTSFGLPLPSRKKSGEIGRLLRLVKADDYADRPVQQLSGGERQRIYLAQSLLGNPKILLLDEPLSNLDPHYQETFINLLKDIQDRLDITILFTAHDPNPLLKVMDRVMFFAKGKAAIGQTHEVITSPSLSALYGTSIEVIEFNNRLFVFGDGQNVLGQVAHHHD